MSVGIRTCVQSNLRWLVAVVLVVVEFKWITKSYSFVFVDVFVRPRKKGKIRLPRVWDSSHISIGGRTRRGRGGRQPDTPQNKGRYRDLINRHVLYSVQMWQGKYPPKIFTRWQGTFDKRPRTHLRNYVRSMYERCVYLLFNHKHYYYYYYSYYYCYCYYSSYSINICHTISIYVCTIIILCMCISSYNNLSISPSTSSFIIHHSSSFHHPFIFSLKETKIWTRI